VLLSNVLLSNVLLSNVLLSNVLLSNVLLSNVLLSNVLLSNSLLALFRGVFQTLIEKHFPAPDTQKTLDIFGLRDKKNSIFDDISLSNILTGNQRKGIPLFQFAI